MSLPEPVAVRFTDDTMSVDLRDGRTITVPIAWFPRLLHASPEERTKVWLSPSGLHWDDLDEDLSVAGLLAGNVDLSNLSTTRPARPHFADPA